MTHEREWIDALEYCRAVKKTIHSCASDNRNELINSKGLQKIIVESFHLISIIHIDWFTVVCCQPNASL